MQSPLNWVKSPTQYSNIKLSEFHMTLGKNYATDLEMVEWSGDCEPGAIFEYKHGNLKTLNINHHSIRVHSNLARRAKVDFAVIFYFLKDDADFRVPPTHSSFYVFVPESGQGYWLSERKFYRFLCGVNKKAPNATLEATKDDELDTSLKAPAITTS